MFKRIALFLLTNILILLTISIILNLLGVQPYLTRQGISYQNLMVFCLVWGFGGAFISLLLSKFMAKRFMGVQVIDPNQHMDRQSQWLMQTVYQLADAAGLPKRPEVGIYESDDLNAFATGPTRSNSLVAVSTGLLNRMSEKEVEGVLAHEISHVANGDMVTMTLLQGLVNAFVMFLARVIAFALTSTRNSDGEERSGGASYYIVQFLLEMVFMVLGTMVVAWFSRYREYRADYGSSKLAGKEKMIAALKRLQVEYERPLEVAENQGGPLAALKISSRNKGLLSVFATHPSLEDRIARLENQ